MLEIYNEQVRYHKDSVFMVAFYARATQDNGSCLDHDVDKAVAQAEETSGAIQLELTRS